MLRISKLKKKIYSRLELEIKRGEENSFENLLREKKESRAMLDYRCCIVCSGRRGHWEWSTANYQDRTRDRGVESGHMYIYIYTDVSNRWLEGSRDSVHPIHALHRLPGRPTRIIILTITRTTSRSSPINEKEREEKEGSSSESEWKRRFDGIRRGSLVRLVTVRDIRGRRSKCPVKRFVSDEICDKISRRGSVGRMRNRIILSSSSCEYY